MTFEGMEDALKPPAGARCNHAVLMFDEIATEKRLRWDSQTNCIVGICREHAHKVPIEMENQKDVEEVVQIGRAHV